MKGFRFRLESVLTLRRHVEESLQRSLADSQRVLEIEAAHLDEIERKFRNQIERLSRQDPRGVLDVNWSWLESVYRAALEAQLAEQSDVVGRLAQRVAEEREAVVRASRDKKALERTRQNLLLSFEREIAQKEQKVADEMASNRHTMKQFSPLVT